MPMLTTSVMLPAVMALPGAVADALGEAGASARAPALTSGITSCRRPGRPVGAVAQRDVEDGAVLGDVDLLAGEHAVAPAVDILPGGRGRAAAHGFLGDAVLGEVEQDAVQAQREPVEPLGIVARTGRACERFPWPRHGASGPAIRVFGSDWTSAVLSPPSFPLSQCSFTCGSVRRVMSAGEGVERDLGRAVQRQLVHLVERLVHQAGEQALDEEVAADQLAHQVADGRIVAERHQRAEIAIAQRPQRLAREAPRQLPGQVRGLLVRGLRARRHGPVVAGPGAGGAVADGEDVVVARGLQRRRTTSWLARLVSSPASPSGRPAP